MVALKEALPAIYRPFRLGGRDDCDRISPDCGDRMGFHSSVGALELRRKNAGTSICSGRDFTVVAVVDRSSCVPLAGVSRGAAGQQADKAGQSLTLSLVSSSSWSAAWFVASVVRGPPPLRRRNLFTAIPATIAMPTARKMFAPPSHPIRPPRPAKRKTGPRQHRMTSGSAIIAVVMPATGLSLIAASCSRFARSIHPVATTDSRAT